MGSRFATWFFIVIFCAPGKQKLNNAPPPPTPKEKRTEKYKGQLLYFLFKVWLVNVPCVYAFCQTQAIHIIYLYGTARPMAADRDGECSELAHCKVFFYLLHVS
jgi:hypothetical protein